MGNPRNVGILVFDDVEVLDFAGPYEVFNVASESANPSPFYVYAVGIGGQPVQARGRFMVTPRYSIENCPQADLLIIPGGFGTRPLLKHGRLISWIAEQAEKVELLLSVCTGALLLAKAGLLRDAPATTHHTAFDQLKLLSPTTSIVKDRRFVQSMPKIYTSGGISAGMDLALHMVEKLAGPDVHAAVVEEMEYNWPRSH
jgi:transcriptional regulator GlxA family with amidase domain